LQCKMHQGTEAEDLEENDSCRNLGIFVLEQTCVHSNFDSLGPSVHGQFPARIRVGSFELCAYDQMASPVHSDRLVLYDQERFYAHFNVHHNCA
jgi:hypothetical protein